MKKFIVTIFFGSLFWTTQAQSSTQLLQLHGGPKIGFNVPMHTLDDRNDMEFLGDAVLPEVPIYPTGGAFLEMEVGKFAAVQIEALYSFSGYGWKNGNGTVSENFRNFYIPAIAKFKFGKFGFYAGYQWEILHVAYASIRYNDPRQQTGDLGIKTYRINRDESYNQNNTSLIAGIEFTSKVGLGLFLRYQRGLTNMAKPDPFKSIFEDGDEVYNNLGSFGLYWSFGPKR